MRGIVMRRRNRVALVGLISIALAVPAITAMPASAQPGNTPRDDKTACHLLSSQNAVPANFGAAYNAISPAQELLLKAFCSTSGVEISIGNGLSTQYIYKQGYDWNGTSWTPIQFQGNTLIRGNWYVGSARGILERTPKQIKNRNNFFVAYLCTWTGVQWKCGCRDQACEESLWQLQAFRRK